MNSIDKKVKETLLPYEKDENKKREKSSFGRRNYFFPREKWK